MNISEAMNAVRNRIRVRRSGWITTENATLRLDDDGKTVLYLSQVDLHGTPFVNIVNIWEPKQADVLADDWELV